MSVSKYTPTIGIEAHVQLKTKTKLFAAVNNDARGAPPNTLISHICVGLPGALPYLNQAAIELAAKAAFALNTKPQKFSKFDRKHYFYPDLPKGYQISQYDNPIIVGGHVDISVEHETKRIGIVRAHLEEDAGKNIHPSGADYSLVDLNRAGTPLLEIVSQPDLHSAVEAKAYARELYLLMKYANVSDVDLYHGNLRFDVNVSVSDNPKKLGTRSEVKNLNSFKSVENAINFEIKRQIELLEKGHKIVQETRGWDEAKQKTTPQRGKEESHDYRYMPEPDVPPIEFSDADIESFGKDLPVLPPEIRQKLSAIKIEPKVIEDILDHPAALKNTLEVLAQATAEDARRVAFWFMHAALDHPDQEPQVDANRLIELSGMTGRHELSSNAAKAVFDEMLRSADQPQQIAERLNLLQVSDEQEIEKIVARVLSEHVKAAEDIRQGQLKAIGFLVGQVMAKSRGKANPGVAQAIIKKQLGI